MINHENKLLRSVLCVFSIILVTTVCPSSLSIPEKCLFNAVQYNDVEAARVLLGGNIINLNILYPVCHATLLHIATNKGNLGMIDLLIQFGADIEIQDQWGNTSVYYAIRKQQLQALSTLVNYGAKINHKNDRSNTPLHDAAYHNNKEAVLFLLAQGADSRITNNRGLTACQLALERHHTEIVDLFRTFESLLQNTNLLERTRETELVVQKTCESVLW